MKPHFLNKASSDFFAELDKLTAWHSVSDPAVNTTVQTILSEVSTQGDAALLHYSNTLDRLDASSAAELEISLLQCEQAYLSLSESDRSALDTSVKRIETYHQHQKIESWQITEDNGTLLGQKVTPIARVGVYVPGGKASYPSSVLMNTIPAKVAGVKEIIMVVPTPGGDVNPMVLAAAYVAGVDKVFTVGGAQAIAALAYGTESVPKVDKIVGPGNIYVATAKRYVFGMVGLDMIAGPSEIMIVADDKNNPDWIAMDLFSQAEHDEQAQAVLVSTSSDFIRAVEASMLRLLPTLERAEVIEKSISNRAIFIQVNSLEEACEVVNHVAPEHLELAIDEPEQWLRHIDHSGAVFLGRHTPEALGDYCAGPNHVLPTSSTARFSSPLGVYDFQKRTSIIGCSPKGASELAKVASVMARSEGLTAHARSAEYRIEDE